MRLIDNLKLLAIAVISPIVIASPLTAKAAIPAPINTGAKISFTFDDGYTSAISQAAPTLAKYGYTGTSYVITGCVGMTKAPNTCHADTSKTYMSWPQIQSLQNTYGWEIGSHTVDHYCLASNASVDPDDCQTNTMTMAQVDAELANSKAALTANGINVTDMATPYGDYNKPVLAEIAKYYNSHRGFADTGYNTAPYNKYILRDQIVDGNVSVSTLESYVNQAVANNQWLIFSFHDIKTKASKHQYDYEYNTSALSTLASYIKNKNVPVVNIRDGLINGANLLSNPSFDNGMTGWSTDTPGNVALNSGNNGSYPSPANSIYMTSTTKDAHLFSPRVNVGYGNNYMLQSFMNIQSINSGSLSFFIDEYDANGNWVSGQYKQGVSFPWPQTEGFAYTPSSANVTSASLQVVIPANSGIQAYLDNFDWIMTSEAATPPPVQTNLMPNGTFDAGISSGWRTDDPSNITADSGNNGSPANPANSVKMTAVAATTHLFSPKITVVSGKTYTISSYVSVKQLSSGEVGFYVDEYDSNGNWISGKYITGVRSVSSTTVSFNYTPSSSNVATASLQFILVGNSNIVAYVDNVVWIQN